MGTRFFIYVIACVLSFANLFWLGDTKPFQLVLFTMIFNILAALLAWHGFLIEDDKGTLKFQVICWTICALIWMSMFMTHPGFTLLQ